MPETGGIKALWQSVKWVWPVAVPALPFLLAIGLVQFIGTPFESKELPALANDQTAAMRHAADRINYVSAVALHTGICLGAIFYFFMVLRRILTTGWVALCLMMALTAGSVIALLFLATKADWAVVLYQVSYANIDLILRQSALALYLTGNGPPGEMSRLAMAVLFPSALGIVSVVLGAGVTCTALRQVRTATKEDWAAAFGVNMRILFRCFYALSAVLVTSTVTALLFFRLPSGLVPVKPAFVDFTVALSTYTGSVATFWGAIYTLTLLAVFAAPVAILYVGARHHVETLDPKPELRDWLREHGLDTSVGQSLKNMVVVLAPLLVGPLGDITQAFG